MSGRSPYATRARRRQLDTQAMMMAVDQDHDDDAAGEGMGHVHGHGHGNGRSPRFSMGSSASTGTSGSTFRLGQSLVQARLSLSPRPPSVFSLTPNHNHSGSGTGTGTVRTFFGGRNHPPNHHNHNHHPREDRDPVETTVLNTTTCTQEVGTTATAATATSATTPPSPPADIRDGIDVTQLRQLTLSCLRSNSHMGAFYASILHSKTQEPHDTVLYARSLLTSGGSAPRHHHHHHSSNAKRAVRLLEQAGLLSHPNTAVSNTLRLEAVLLAAQALAELEEWTTLLTLVEDPHLYASLLLLNQQEEENLQPPAFLSVPPIDDDDVHTWQALAHVVPLSPTEIHPVAQLLYHRGQAYAETGHPLRAATFFQWALKTDPKCLAALDGLLQDNPLVTATQALELLQQESPQSQDPQQYRPPAWLYDLSRARIHVAAPTLGRIPPTTTMTTTTNTNHHVQFLDTTTATATAATTSTMTAAAATTLPDKNRADSFWKDASSLEFLTPIEKGTGMDETGINTDIDTGRDTVGGVGGSHADSSALDRLLDEYKLDQSPDVLAMAAQRAFRLGNLNQALEYCQRLMQVDPLCTTAAYVQVATLVALGHKRALFRLAHEWIEASPQSATSWFAVGAYYYACARYHVAQRHFCRATRLDPQVVAAWMAFGCAFAAVEESDQALASFRAAQRLAPGDATSLLYIGMEYLRTNHTSLAQHFLTASHQIHASALVQNELGVYCLREKSYDQAATWFVKALSGPLDEPSSSSSLSSTWSTSRMITLMEGVTDPYWEPTIFNLAYALRKMRRFEAALICLERSCTLCPDHASAWSARGFVCHLDGEVDQAIDFYHQALACKPKDPFSTEMLQRALTDALAETSELLQNIGLEANRSSSSYQDPALPQPSSDQDPLGVGRRDKGRTVLFTTSTMHPSSSSSRRPRDSLHSMAMSDDGLSISVETLGEDVDMG